MDSKGPAFGGGPGGKAPWRVPGQRPGLPSVTRWHWVMGAGGRRIGAWGSAAPASGGGRAPTGAWGFGAVVAGGFSGAGRGGVGRRPCVVSAGEAIAGASGGRLARVVAADSVGPRIGAWGF